MIHKKKTHLPIRQDITTLMFNIPGVDRDVLQTVKYFSKLLTLSLLVFLFLHFLQVIIVDDVFFYIM